ncbi:MAG: FAD-linked oxidase C-terminal domain-containing protein [Sulfolobales archaeon]
MSDKILEKVKEFTGIYFGEGHAIITDFELERSSQADEIFRRAVEILSRHGIKSYYMATDRDPDFDKIYQLRRSMYPATVRARKMKYIIIEDVVVPISRIQDYLNTLESISTRYAREIYVGGHIGDGNLHPKFEGDLEDPKDRDLVLKMGREIALEAVRLGGSVSAEHGIGTMKIELLREEFRYRESEHTMNLMREIKKTFDPGGILNPGRVIPIEK